MTAYEKSCGTVPYTKRNGEIFYLLIRSPGGRNCGFPKGHVEHGESEVETAFRETLEETSVKARINPGFRHEISYLLSNGVHKTVVYFAADFGDQMPAHSEGFEDFEYLILPLDEACTALTFENTREMLRKAHKFIASL
jgi:8-oxo-dGTP pyrophosphatase MutT (NUDIX family)